MWSRIHLIPLLQAEEDRDLVRRQWANETREQELLGSKTRVYNSDRWVTMLFVWQEMWLIRMFKICAAHLLDYSFE